MKARYNLVKRIDPQTKKAKWYAVPVSKGTMDEDETAKMATADTTLSKGEYKYSMEVTSEKLIELVVSGITITIGKLGKLRVSFGSKGAENIEDFDILSMIQNQRFVFTPSKELKNALGNATFELEGVVEDGIKYGSLKSYLKAKGLWDEDDDEDEGGDEDDGPQVQ